MDAKFGEQDAGLDFHPDRARDGDSEFDRAVLVLGTAGSESAICTVLVLHASSASAFAFAHFTSLVARSFPISTFLNTDALFRVVSIVFNFLSFLYLRLAVQSGRGTIIQSKELKINQRVKITGGADM